MSFGIFRRLLAGLLLVFVGLSLLPIGGAEAAAKATADPIGDLASCVRSTGVLEALFLFDTSGSLKDTDRDHRRTIAANAALTALADLATTDARNPIKVDVGLAQFSVDYVQPTEWESLTRESLSSVQDAAKRATDPQDGLDTDFATALFGARSDLAERSAMVQGKDGAPPCTAIFLFTDGKFDVEPRIGKNSGRAGVPKAYAPGLGARNLEESDKIIGLGISFVCGDKGVANVLRSDQVTIIAIALSSPVQKIAPVDQEFIGSVAAGRMGPATCGDPANARGAYFAADDLGSLISSFNAAASSIAGGTAVPGAEMLAICANDPCTEGTRSLIVSPVMSRVTALVDLGRTDGAVVVRAPDGSSTTIAPDGEPTRIGGALVSTRWLDRHVASINVQFEDYSRSSGEWSFSLVAARGGDQGRIQLFAYSDLRARLDGDPDLRIGQKRQIHVVVDGEGADPLSRLKGSTSTVTMTASVPNTGDSLQIPLTAEGDGHWVGSWTVPDDWRASETTLSTRLAITTAAGLSLEPVVSRAPVSVGKPASYPQIAPASLRLGTVEGRGTVKGSILAEGGVVGGCVEIPNPNYVDLPNEKPSPSFDTTANPDDCLRLDAGEKREIPVSFKVAESMSGPVRGTLPVVLRSDDSSKEMTTEIPFAFETKLGVDRGEQALWALLLVVLGIAIPMALLYALNYYTARYVDLDDLRGVRVRVLLRPDGTLEGIDDDGDGTGMPPAVHIDDWSNLGDALKPKAFQWSGIDFRTAIPSFPIGEPFGLAEVGASSFGDFGLGHKNGEAKIGLGLVSSWIVTVSGEQPTLGIDDDGEALPNSIVGAVVMFARSGGETVRSDTFFGSNGHRISDCMKKLAAARRATLAATGSAPALIPVGAGSAVVDDDDDFDPNAWN